MVQATMVQLVEDDARVSAARQLGLLANPFPRSSWAHGVWAAAYKGAEAAIFLHQATLFEDVASNGFAVQRA